MAYSVCPKVMRLGLAKILYWSDRYILLKFLKIVSLGVDKPLPTRFQPWKGSLEVSRSNLFQRQYDSPLDECNIFKMVTFLVSFELWEQKTVYGAEIGGVRWLWKGCNPYPCQVGGQNEGCVDWALSRWSFQRSSVSGRFRLTALCRHARTSL